MKIIFLTLLALIILFSINPVIAQSYHETGTKLESIWSGYKRGKLTHPEIRQQTRQHRYIRNKIFRSKCHSGAMSKNERARIMRNKKIAQRNMHSFNLNNISKL